ncbi:Protein of unknown function [Faunimonas pinastri]|uniref:DUF3829 domain-containing protein n=2 Tax=Faunimonas pinastri TaxID=1855383 RepID=A0A1H9NBX2_9HYPH|nr:Protein of unknown function [Faunimonas pinastri]
MRLFLRSLMLIGLACVSPALAQQPEAPTQAEAASPAATEAVLGKLNAYVALLNRTLRASKSLDRYESWVEMKKGPTGREMNIYGLYSLYDVRSEIGEASAAASAAPAMPELDAAIPAYIAAYQRLAPIVTKADAYYEREDYRADKMAEGKAMHKDLASAGDAFLAERKKVDALYTAEKRKSEVMELAMIEQQQGKKARWHVSNVMIRASHVMDILTDPDAKKLDMAAFRETLGAYAGAVKDMDNYSADNPNSFFTFESEPRSLLGKLRGFDEKLNKSKGRLTQSAGSDLEWIVNDYNSMISSARSATTFSE